AELAPNTQPRAGQRGQPATNRQPQAGSAEFTGGRAVDLLEILEDTRVILGGDTDPGVAHTELELVASLVVCRRHANRALARELQRIAQQIDQNLLQLLTIAVH